MAGLAMLVATWREWRYRRVFWHRFTHGKCTSCGKYKPATGSTACLVCMGREREAVWASLRRVARGESE